MLRDPVDRAYSHYWNDVREGLEKRSFLDALAEEQRSGPGGWGVSSLYIDCGRYADQVARYLDGSAPGGSSCRSLEDFVTDRTGTMADIHSFLGVGPVPAGAPLRRMNSISLPRNRLGGALLGSGRVRRLARATVPRPLRGRLRGALLEEAAPPPMDPAARGCSGRSTVPTSRGWPELLGRAPPWEALVAGGSLPG